MTAALLTLADSRLPAGGHTHSGGVEQAIAAGIVHDPRSLEVFLRRRLTTAGSTAAGLAAAACRAAGRDEPRRASLARLDAEADARTPSPALRQASRQQGRGLVRVGRRAWPTAAWDDLPPHPHHPLALGVAAAAAGLGPADAAQAAAYLSITGSATAAQRLLAMDPITVATVTARLAAEVDAVGAGADQAAAGGPAPTDGEPGPAWLPAGTDPLLDLLAEVHADRDDRYFAS
ncbi:urease accessory protein UreF [Klenkia taihuensis]|uniref:Urease accessory protein UreF n=1 Tax=Klenkia taihuensis TaxID=1225127 RepID=A0A1I1PC81_9ACTN|nr:urease accessory UreF family protein [Klenkia taihuensis]GHE11408.1 urease accessory protein UreF [Klenkia taihuensis]SFD05248.1 urease accessory protein [Klenkia taihuensis]